jgi:hypothetical protein
LKSNTKKGIRKALIPLAGMPNQRDMDSLQSLIEGKDQRFRSVYIIPIDNPITGQRKIYVEKRPGFEQAAIGDCLGLISEGCRPTAIHFSRATGKYITAFCGDDIYVDCTFAGGTVDPPDRGDGRLLAVSDSGNIYISSDNGATFGSNTAPSARAWKWSAWSGTNYCVVTGSISGGLSKLIYSTSGEAGSWTEIEMPDPSPNTNPNWHRIWRASDNSHLIAVNNSSEGFIATSTDHGVNWTVSPRILTIGQALYGADYNPTTNTYVVVGSPGSSNAHGAYSRNGGTTWTATTGLTTFCNWQVVRYVPWLDIWLAGGTGGIGGKTLGISTDDGATWTTSLTGVFTDMQTLGNYVVGSSGTSTYSTQDGTNWTTTQITSPSQSYAGSAFNGDGWFAYSYANNSKSAFIATADTPAGTWTDYGANQPNINFNHVTSRYA